MIVICCAVLAPFVAFGLWVFWPDISGRLEVRMGIQAIRSHDLGGGISDERAFEADTFTNECSSSTIQSLYESAACALADRSDTVQTYGWVDQLGWDRVSSVLQTSGGYIEVRASCNNDNDSVSIRFAPGVFARPDSRLLSSIDLPKGTLRCEWPQNQK